MDTSYILKLQQESKLSPEALGSMIGISGMTIRRWTETSEHEELSELYKNAVHKAVFQLVIEGKLDSDGPVAQKSFSESGNHSQQAAIRALGFPEDLTGKMDNHQDKIMTGLSHIGSMESRRQKVESQKKKLPTYTKLGKDWHSRISTLIGVIQSKKLVALDKFPAYGALFYLLMVFDLVPDSIPIFGLIDDFGILGIATTYYLNRHKSPNG